MGPLAFRNHEQYGYQLTACSYNACGCESVGRDHACLTDKLPRTLKPSVRDLDDLSLHVLVGPPIRVDDPVFHRLDYVTPTPASVRSCVPVRCKAGILDD
jgi:hypothetical protein